MFTDESSFHMKQVIRHVWKRRGDKYFVSTVRHSSKIHAWGCFSKHGFGKLVLFRQTLNSKLMSKIYKNELLPPAKKWFSNTGYNRKLLEYNDPKHISKTSKTFKINNGIQSLPWASQSPDCNFIENVWSLMKLKINKRPPTSINNFIFKIKKEWKNLRVEFAKKLVDSMEKKSTTVNCKKRRLY